MHKSVGVDHVAPFCAVTQGAGPSTQQRDAFQKKTEQRPTTADTETLNWIMDDTLH